VRASKLALASIALAVASYTSAFAAGGFEIMSAGSGDSLSNCGLIQLDGKIVAAGRVNTNRGQDVAMARVSSSGSPDNSFGGDGVVTVPVSNTSEQAKDCVQQPNGKLVVAGTSSGKLMLMRMNSDGSLDGSFGKMGKAIVPIGRAFASAESVAMLPDGRIAVSGYSQSTSPQSMVVAVFSSSGKPDKSFAGDGIAMLTNGSGPATGQSIAVDASNRLVVAGRLDPAVGQSRNAVVRYLLNGSLDSSFGSGGMVVSNYSGALSSRSNAVAIQPDGKIVITGSAELPNGPNSRAVIAFARLLADGSPDPAFGTGGEQVLSEFFPGDLYGGTAFDLALGADGRIVAVTSYDPTEGDFRMGIVALLPNGAVDTTMGGTGIAGIQPPSGYSYIAGNAIALQSDGEILTFGRVETGFSVSMMIGRFLPDGSPDSSF